MKKRAPGCLGQIGDDMLPMGIISYTSYKDPYEPTRIQWNITSFFVFFAAHWSLAFNSVYILYVTGAELKNGKTI